MGPSFGPLAETLPVRNGSTWNLIHWINYPMNDKIRVSDVQPESKTDRTASCFSHFLARRTQMV